MSYYSTRQLVKAVERLREELLKELRGCSEQQQKAMRDAAKASIESNKHRLPIPLPVLAVCQIPEADQRDQKAEHKKDYTLQLLLTVGTWLAFGAAAVYAGIAAYQARLMNGTLKQIQLQTKAAEQAAYAACTGAQISRSTLIEVQNSGVDTHNASLAAVYQALAATTSERADITLKILPGDNGFGAFLLFFNVGKTAAINMRLRFRAVFIPEAKHPDFTYPRKETYEFFQPRAETGQLNIDGTSKPLHLVVKGADGNLTIPSAEEAQAYTAGRAKSIVYGRLTYHDTFGGAHWRNFCQTYVNGAADEKCVAYNAGDLGGTSFSPSIVTANQPPPDLPPCIKPN